MGNKEKLEKAKVNMDYEEKLEKAMELYPTANTDQRYVLECLFPELAESEDERIRKHLINCVTRTIPEADAFKEISKEQILAWLEKQGTSYTKRDVDNAFVEGMALAKNELEKQGGCEPVEGEWPYTNPASTLDGEIENIWNNLSRDNLFTASKIGFSEVIHHFVNWLEKQGEQKIPVEMKTPEESLGIDSKTYNEIVNDCLYNDESKPTPKFHEGEWVVDNNGKVAIIYDLQKAGYVGHYTNGTDFVCKYGNEHLLHLWTIKDAKDGDVLQLGTVTAIFKKYIGQEKCICYRSIDEDGVFEIPIEDGEDNIYGCTNTTPATKEQRDLLFQKMNEEGYEWNAELKKVSKITTPADVGFEELGKAWAEEANKQNLANSAKTCKKSQRMVSAEAKEALYDKAAWSEEDEEMLDGIILQCEKYGHQEQINWLKSIKQRIKGE